MELDTYECAVMSDIPNRLREVDALNTKRKKNNPATWGDIQDLRRGLQADSANKIDAVKGELINYMDVKFEALQNQISEIRQMLE